MIKRLGVLAAAGGLTSLKGQAPAAKAHIPMNYAPNLDQDFVYEFLFDAAKTTVDEPEVKRADYVEWDVKQRKSVDTISATPAGDKLRLFWTEKETYELTQGGPGFRAFRYRGRL
jgi:hypothetical protein